MLSDASVNIESAGNPKIAIRGKHLYWLIVFVALILGLFEWGRQWREDRFVGALAREVVEKAQASDNRSRVLALQAYLRTHISYHGAPYGDRPFFRASAQDTLRSGKGYCGEVTRAFVRMSTAVGIRAHRINLYGRLLHVVAEAELGPGDKVIVDCQHTPQVIELERLERVIARPEYGSYATLNLRRLGLDRFISPFQVEIGPLSDWLESPHAIKASLWFLLAIGLTVAGRLLKRPEHLKGRFVKDAPNEMDEILQPFELADKSSILRCPDCAGELSVSTDVTEFLCLSCHGSFPVRNGIPRLISAPMRQALSGNFTDGRVDRRRVATAESFGFEWNRFPEMRVEWERNFRDYMAPHSPEWFRGKRLLDAGCGSGRHAFYAAEYGAEVWAADLGAAVEVARRNTAEHRCVTVVQADLHSPPFAPDSFDMVYSFGVLHHLPDPEAVFRKLIRYVKPGGWIHIYLYWKAEGQPLKRRLLALITAIRRVTIRLPHRLLYYLAYPAAMIAVTLFVWPYRLLSAMGLRGIAEKLPMNQYRRYPFRVCVNDQFDRFSAPIEHRYTRAEVVAWFERAGLDEISVTPNFGWVATGRKPE
ncbi:MAG: methyltransferase domain-containing protein [Blastocatellia bacterium]